MQVQQERETVGNNAVDVACDRVRTDLGALLILAERVVKKGGGHEDARQAAGKLLAHDTGALKRFRGDLEHKALLRVHMDGFARRNFEEGSVEGIDVLNKSAPAGVDFARRKRVGVIERVGIPAIGRHGANRVDTIGQQLPEGFGRISAAGEAAACADDGDRLGGEQIHAIHLAANLFARLLRKQGELDCGDVLRVPAGQFSAPSSSARRASSSLISWTSRSSDANCSPSFAAARASPTAASSLSAAAAKSLPRRNLLSALTVG